MLIIGLTFGFGSGFLFAGGQGESGHAHDHAGHGDKAHDHSALTQWEGEAPGLSLRLTGDMGNARNLEVITTGFTFDPRNVNGAAVAGTGHAHIYVNGEKVARAYSPFTHLDFILPGDVIRVTLNANDHTGWGLGETPIATEITAQ